MSRLSDSLLLAQGSSIHGCQAGTAIPSVPQHLRQVPSPCPTQPIVTTWAVAAIMLTIKAGACCVGGWHCPQSSRHLSIQVGKLRHRVSHSSCVGLDPCLHDEERHLLLPTKARGKQLPSPPRINRQPSRSAAMGQDAAMALWHKGAGRLHSDCPAPLGIWTS